MQMPSKENTIKIGLSTIATIVALIGAVFTLDARYAHAEDVERDKIETQKIIRQTTTILRKQMIEDKLFELDIKQQQDTDRRLSPIDTALQQRYKRQLDELHRSNIN